jgi:hypothetical protein
MIVFDAQKKKFFTFERINATKALLEVLKTALTGKFDKKMKSDVALFHGQPQIDHSRSWSRSLLRPQVIIPILVAVVLVIILGFVLRPRLAKIE